MRVLLIDDNPDDRALTRRELARHFPDLDIRDIRADVELRQALTEPVALVITDFELRWTNGIEVLERVKQRHPDCPVVMFTGTGTQEIAVAAMKAGLDDYVVKSAAHYVRLPAAIDAALGRAAARARGRRRQQRVDDMLGTLGVGVFRADGDGRVVDVNAAMLAFLGASALDEARALDLTPLVPAAGGDGRPQVIRVPRVGSGEVELRVAAGRIEAADGAWTIEGVAVRA